jgi:hypothetical protein
LTTVLTSDDVFDLQPQKGHRLLGDATVFTTIPSANANEIAKLC